MKAEVLQRYADRSGIQAIRTNALADPYETMKIYRERNVIEEGFKKVKHEGREGHLMATEVTYRGKLFIYTIG